MLKLIDAGYTQCVSLDNETGKIKLNTEAYKELAKAKLASQIAEYDATIARPTHQILTHTTISRNGKQKRI